MSHIFYHCESNIELQAQSIYHARATQAHTYMHAKNPLGIRHTQHVSQVIHVKNSLGIFRELVKNRQPPGIEPGASDFSCQRSTT